MKYPIGFPPPGYLEKRDRLLAERRKMLKSGTYVPEARKRLDALVIQIEIYLKEQDKSIRADYGERDSIIEKELKKAFVNLKDILCVEIYK